MNSRNARKIRNGIIWTDYVLLNPLLAEYAPSILTRLGYRAYLRTMKAHGHTMEVHEYDL